MAGNPPASLKVIQPFTRLAKEYDNRDPVVAYWSRYYAVQVGIKNKTKDNVSYLMSLMDLLEKSKQKLTEEEAVMNDIVAQAHLESKGVQLFLWADNEDRAGRFNKNVVKSFYSSTLIFEILTVFGELNDEIIKQRKYGKWKATYINNCLKKGETPMAGPAGWEDDTQEPNASSGPPSGLTDPSNTLPDLPPSVVYPPSGSVATHPSAQYPPQSQSYVPQPWSYSQPPQSYPPQPNSHPPQSQSYPSQPQSYPPQPQTDPVKNMKPSTQPLPNDSSANEPIKSTGSHLGPLDYAKAQKYCKYASSALQYEDVTTAIDNLQKALRLLQTGKDS
ncbi:vacuolar protein sorting-associated protein VTA1 homolog [Xenia sp. Carnegie-2017]|uniref:vacuolar protein sorting-associated protein VTA1 homolog n=1 Tax=Xenia sp. Carnegie-2017 TaxID=2897299 RepID=UPI001F034342|nr:vacuolar protein sorting-associated protein VTA1 homolog [Xenia sp. Carnegie-2017]